MVPAAENVVSTVLSTAELSLSPFFNGRSGKGHCDRGHRRGNDIDDCCPLLSRTCCRNRRGPRRDTRHNPVPLTDACRALELQSTGLVSTCGRRREETPSVACQSDFDGGCCWKNRD